jgi:hypothetical protein
LLSAFSKNKRKNSLIRQNPAKRELSNDYKVAAHISAPIALIVVRILLMVFSEAEATPDL